MKKTVLTCLLLSLYVLSRSQVIIEDSSTLTKERWRDSMFRMDMQYVPTGILTEYSLFPFDTYRHDGINNDDDTIQEHGQLLMLHNILTASRVNNNATIIATDSLFARAFNHSRTTGTIPFILVYQQYNRIRQTALSENLLKIEADSVGILDVPGRTTSPYDSYDFFAVSPYTDTVVQFNTVSFSFPASLWQMAGVTRVSVDFNDGGGFRNIAPNGTASIYYNTEGKKIITARISVAGSTKTARCQIYYRRPKSYSSPAFSWHIEADYVYTNEAQYTGVPLAVQQNSFFPCGGNSIIQKLLCNIRPSANVFVETGCGSVFDRPIIIVEGFDPDQSLNITALRDRFANFNFMNVLASYGYDFVYVDFTNNGTYIENNAKVLEAVINRVNQMKTGTHNNIVIGYSMGGLIARWCLRDMEDRGLQHQVGHFFSYDAPQQGANTPLGLQYLFQELETDLPYLRFNKSFRQISEASRSPAARQMLVVKPTGPFGTLDPIRAAFAQRLVNKGYPQMCTNHGMAFGRGDNPAGTKNASNGAQWNFGPGSRLLKANLTWFLVNFQSNTYAVQQNNINDYILRYRFQGVTFRKIFGLPVIPVVSIKIKNYKYTSPNSYDEAPGSFERTQARFAGQIDGWANGAARDATTDGRDAHNFVGTVSALDMQNQGYSAGNRWQSGALFSNIDGFIQNPGTVAGNNLSNPALSPFGFVITATSNNAGSPNISHNTDLRNAFATFMTRKILNATPNFNCATNGFCTTYSAAINGQPLICNEGTFQVQEMSGLTYLWTLNSSNVQIISGQGTPVVRLRRISDGNATLRITVTNACGSSRTSTLLLQAGAPVTSRLQPFGDYQVCPNRPANFGVLYDNKSVCWSGDDGAQITSIAWQTDPGNQIEYDNSMACPVSNIIKAGAVIRFGSTVNFPSYVKVQATNGCGTSGWSAPLFVYRLSTCFSMLRVEVSPNPTPDKVVITVESGADAMQQNPEQPPVIKQVRLFDIAGRLLQSFAYSGSQKQVQLNIGNFKPGSYIIEVWSGNTVTRKKVMIQR